MKIKSSAFVIVALLATSAALAESPTAKPADPRPASRERTLVAEIAGGMREIIRAVRPVISLPAIDVKLPALEIRPAG
jgi:hypothetical protein